MICVVEAVVENILLFAICLYFNSLKTGQYKSFTLLFINLTFPPKVSASFQKKIQNKIKDLLQQMEEGLKTTDPHDFSTYTGWTGLVLLLLRSCRAGNLVSRV